MTDAEYLKSIRTRLGNKLQGHPLSQTEMAKKLGYANQESISRIEQGHTDMAPQTKAHLETIDNCILDP